MKNIAAKELLKKYKEGNCTETELALLESWYLTSDNEKIDLSIEQLNAAKSQVWTILPIHQREKKNVKLWPKLASIASAAVVLICLSFSLYFYLNKHNNPAKKTQAVAKILPGGKKATLTLANGVSISLNEANIGKIGDQGGSSIFKTEDGQLTYNTSKAAATSQINLLTIPNGGYYNLTLEDGTKVWLNSASSLKYPTIFNGNERIVELTGEGYFEVAHNASKPFKVIANNQTVQVLGTHFNINAYHDENSIATTLVEGSVRVSTKNAANVLIPGQQANVIGDLIKVKAVNVDDETAWIHNEFVFNNEDMGSIMRKISRWYDVEVQCPSDLSRMVFTGSVSRSKNIKQVLRIMELTESVHFNFQGRRITVMP
ncbi:FecR family protein [Pedobacter frigiditerrae]|uniref:FecR family protein n=1 Tax=Pedobacter frigiditerrae TaxID=2530452 RepID=UPI00293051D3|nr:FecR domain-containing protein [Pedobacter frigiditerrae]